ncbi:L,D-transpeptidase [Palleronia sp. LCG004]|uniref:L,D-transpeptidase family protein n=1 Tax=Palleronia sp. LCG004 TaxID=3079304 RepID=UPI0029427923|nr:L,D-transpeptidase family protein [Palleronia sp. LCG004]WOI55534.1 L,D-transpeptidase family protein [Palleronia sp. LCG004]
MRPADLVLTPRGLRIAGRYLPCTIGRGGIATDKREGDGATPRGVHRIVGLLYRADRMARPAPWARAIGPRDLWSDDPDAPDYNHNVLAPYPRSHERLCRADRLYDLVLITDWNWPHAVPGRGSAIFIHRWRARGFPTAGCVALSPEHLFWLAGRVSLGTRLIVR